MFEVLHLDVVVFARFEFDRCGALGFGLRHPLIDEYFSINEKTAAIIRFSIEGIGF